MRRREERQSHHCSPSVLCIESSPRVFKAPVTRLILSSSSDVFLGACAARRYHPPPTSAATPIPEETRVEHAGLSLINLPDMKVYEVVEGVCEVPIKEINEDECLKAMKEIKSYVIVSDVTL